MTKYLIRLDDACPTMNVDKWARMEAILDKYGIRPMVGIVPDNKDKKLMQSPAAPNFWDKARAWQSKGWTIALHGLQHQYHKCKGGLNPLWTDSEFCGLDYDTQLQSLSRGKELLTDQGLNVEYFFAPSHTFDLNTVKALQSIGIYRISDTIALEPYRRFNTVFIPQIGGKCRKMPMAGTYTFCFHPNTMKDKDFIELDTFLSENQDAFIGFDDIDYNAVGNLGLKSRILRTIYFIRRKLRSPKK